MIPISDFILFLHPTFGILSLLAALWVFVDTLNASDANAARIRGFAVAVAVFMGLAWIFGGYWYVTFYAPEKAMILKGPFPMAHTFFMETKEHLFFIPLILAFYLPFAVRDKLFVNKGARNMVLAVTALIVMSTFSIEGAGALINYGVKASAVQTGVKGVEK